MKVPNHLPWSKKGHLLSSQWESMVHVAAGDKAISRTRIRTTLAYGIEGLLDNMVHHARGQQHTAVQGYLAHKKTAIALG